MNKIKEIAHLALQSCIGSLEYKGSVNHMNGIPEFGEWVWFDAFVELEDKDKLNPFAKKNQIRIYTADKNYDINAKFFYADDKSISYKILDIVEPKHDSKDCMTCEFANKIAQLVNEYKAFKLNMKTRYILQELLQQAEHFGCYSDEIAEARSRLIFGNQRNKA